MSMYVYKYIYGISKISFYTSLLSIGLYYKTKHFSFGVTSVFVVVYCLCFGTMKG